jgi:hypothetical protein
VDKTIIPYVRGFFTVYSDFSMLMAPFFLLGRDFAYTRFFDIPNDPFSLISGIKIIPSSGAAIPIASLAHIANSLG